MIHTAVNKAWNSMSSDVVHSWFDLEASTLWILAKRRKGGLRKVLEVANLPCGPSAKNPKGCVSTATIEHPGDGCGVVVSTPLGIVAVQDVSAKLIYLYRGCSGIPFLCLLVGTDPGLLLGVEVLKCSNAQKPTAIVIFCEKGGHVYLIKDVGSSLTPTFSWKMHQLNSLMSDKNVDVSVSRTSGTNQAAAFTSSESNAVYFVYADCLWQLRLVPNTELVYDDAGCDELLLLEPCDIHSLGGRSSWTSALAALSARFFKDNAYRGVNANIPWRAYIRLVDDFSSLPYFLSTSLGVKGLRSESICPLKLMSKSLVIPNVLEDCVENVDVVWMVFATASMGICVCIMRTFLNYYRDLTEPMFVYPLDDDRAAERKVSPLIHFLGGSVAPDNAAVLFWSGIDELNGAAAADTPQDCLYIAVLPLPVIFSSPIPIRCPTKQRVQVIKHESLFCRVVVNRILTTYGEQELCSSTPYISKICTQQHGGLLQEDVSPDIKVKDFIDLACGMSGKGRITLKAIGKTVSCIYASPVNHISAPSFVKNEFSVKTDSATQPCVDGKGDYSKQKVAVRWMNAQLIPNSFVYHKNIPHRRLNRGGDVLPTIGWQDTHSFSFLVHLQRCTSFHTLNAVYRFEFCSRYNVAKQLLCCMPLNAAVPESVLRTLISCRLLQPEENENVSRCLLQKGQMTSDVWNFVWGVGLLCGRFRAKRNISSLLHSGSLPIPYDGVCRWVSQVVYHLLGCSQCRLPKNIQADMDYIYMLLRENATSINLAARFRFELQQLQLCLVIALTGEPLPLDTAKKTVNPLSFNSSKTVGTLANSNVQRKRRISDTILQEGIRVYKLVTGLLEVVHLAESWNCKSEHLNSSWTQIGSSTAVWLRKALQSTNRKSSIALLQKNGARRTLIRGVVKDANVSETVTRDVTPSRRTPEYSIRSCTSPTKHNNCLGDSIRAETELLHRSFHRLPVPPTLSGSSSWPIYRVLFATFKSICSLLCVYGDAVILAQNSLEAHLDVLEHWDATLTALLGECSVPYSIQPSSKYFSAAQRLRSNVYTWLICVSLVVPVETLIRGGRDILRVTAAHGALLLDPCEVDALVGLLVWDVLLYINPSEASKAVECRLSAILKKLMTPEIGTIAATLLLGLGKTFYPFLEDTDAAAGSMDYSYIRFQHLKRSLETSLYG